MRLLDPVMKNTLILAPALDGNCLHWHRWASIEGGNDAEGGLLRIKSFLFETVYPRVVVRPVHFAINFVVD